METRALQETQGRNVHQKQVFEVQKDSVGAKETLVQWVLQAFVVKNVRFLNPDLLENGVLLGQMDLQGPWER